MKLDVSGYKRIIFQVCRAKIKLALLAFLDCGKFVKTPI